MTEVLKNSRHPDHPVAPQFTQRWSRRAFAPDAMTETDVLILLEAARWSPSSSNNQPWRFIWSLSGEAGFDRIMASLAPSNFVWASKAAAVIVVASATMVLRDGVEKANGAHAFDAGAAWAHLALQAHLNGFFAHAMGGFDTPTLATAINLPPAHVTHAVVAVGRPGSVERLPEALRARELPNGRLPLAETTRRGSFQDEKA